MVANNLNLDRFPLFRRRGKGRFRSGGWSRVRVGGQSSNFTGMRIWSVDRRWLYFSETLWSLREREEEEDTGHGNNLNIYIEWLCTCLLLDYSYSIVKVLCSSFSFSRHVVPGAIHKSHSNRQRQHHRTQQILFCHLEAKTTRTLPRLPHHNQCEWPAIQTTPLLFFSFSSAFIQQTDLSTLVRNYSTRTIWFGRPLPAPRS